MRIPGLTSDTIELNAEAGSISRGKQYVESGAVRSLRRVADDHVEAYVQGSGIAPYLVDIRHNNEGIVSADCTCPYVEGSWCRHIVATLYAVLVSGNRAERSLNEMLDDFERVELIHLIERLAEVYPGIVDMIEDAHRHQEGS